MKQLDLFFIKEEEKKVVEIIPEPIAEKMEAEVLPTEEVQLEKEEIEIPAEINKAIIVEKKTVSAKQSKKNVVQKRGRKSFDEMDAEVDLIEVPEDEVLFQKQYYSISEVAKWFKVNTSLIRFWENEFDVLKPKKNRKGDRLFRPEDVKNVQLIYHLLRQRKFSMHGAKEYLQSNKQHAETNKVLIQSLTKLKSFLTELKTNLGE